MDNSSLKPNKSSLILVNGNKKAKLSFDSVKEVADSINKQINNTKKDKILTLNKKELGVKQSNILKSEFDFETYSDLTDSINLSKNNFEAKKLYAKNLFDNEVLAFAKNSMGVGEDMISSISKTGTIKDKLYSMSQLIQESSLHNLSTLKSLVDFVKNKKCRDSIVGVELLVDLFTNTLLPDRHLLKLNERIQHGTYNVKAKDLIFFMYEENLKEIYNEFVLFLKQKLFESTFEWFRKKILKFSFQLLSSKPEGEQKLLAFLVSFLGTSYKTLISSAIFYFINLLKSHPLLKKEILKEIKDYYSKSNLSAETHRYFVTLMNQFIYSNRKSEIKFPQKAIKVYLDILDKVQGTISIKESAKVPKVIALLFNGINRAVPFLNTSREEVFKSRIESLYKATQLNHFKTSYQALKLLFNIYSKVSSPTERFYNSLYHSLLRTDLGNSKKHMLYLSLVYQSVAKDNKNNRILNFVKRIMLISDMHSLSFFVSCLMTILELTKIKNILKILLEALKQKDHFYFKLEMFKNHYHPAIVYLSNKISNTFQNDCIKCPNFSADWFMSEALLENSQKINVNTLVFSELAKDNKFMSYGFKFGENQMNIKNLETKTKLIIKNSKQFTTQANKRKLK